MQNSAQSVAIKRGMSVKVQRNILLVCFLVIPVILASLFIIYPVINMIFVSLTRWDGSSEFKEFVGLKQYIQAFTNGKQMWVSLGNNFLYFIAHSVIIPFQLIVAVILNNKLVKGRNFFKTITFMPYIINGTAIAYMFNFFFTTDAGAFNGLLGAIGLPNDIRWLSDPNLINFTFVFISCWRYFGFGVVIYYAALQSINGEILEASQIDGANGVQTFFYIIMPQVTRITQILLFLNIKGALQVFDIPFVMTGGSGGANGVASTFALHSVNLAFKYHNFGLASAMGVILMVMIVTLSLLQNKIFGDKGDM